MPSGRTQGVLIRTLTREQWRKRSIQSKCQAKIETESEGAETKATNGGIS